MMFALVNSMSLFLLQYLDSKRQMITISRFDNMKNGMRYYRHVENHEPLQKFFDNNNGKHFLISVNDYSKFYKDKDVTKYLEFFTKNYLNQQ
ncbi:MAG: hypothetical protein R6U19_09875 [Bacteroidales bacterium]